jgi:UDPglucose 6-dehydrogenase
LRISVVGTGYVGLVTGVCLSDIGNNITCIDIDQQKVERMRKGHSPIYEPGLEELMKKIIKEDRLHFTADLREGYSDAEVIYIAVGTPQREDGSANLSYIDQVIKDIATNITNDVILVTKSTVPVGTNEYILKSIRKLIDGRFLVDIVSNPEFLREGSAVKDAFEGDRIVIGGDNGRAVGIVEAINKPLGIPIFKTDLRSAEMIKYASNAFLATKISFINEIANICEKLDANIEDVSAAIGMDKRIGPHFLNAGIGYGGSCFPKDTRALVQIASGVEYDFDLLSSVINVNNHQHSSLVKKAKKRLNDLEGKTVALWGLSFKPNTDDMREAPSITISNELINAGAEVVAYDPIAINNAKYVLNKNVQYADSLESSVNKADLLLILTEWEEIKCFDLAKLKELMNEPIVFDGRNSYPLENVKRSGIEYHSVGRPTVWRE